MRYRKLGDTGLMVSEVSFGTIPVLQGSVPVLPDYYNLSEEQAGSCLWTYGQLLRTPQRILLLQSLPR